MSLADNRLRIIQEVSGHRNLEQLQKYLEVSPTQVRGAVSALSMLSPVGKREYPDTPAEQKKAPQNNNSF